MRPVKEQVQWLDLTKGFEVTLLQDEPMFIWWVTHIVKECEYILQKVKYKYQERTHKYGFRVPKYIEKEKHIDNNYVNILSINAVKLKIIVFIIAFEEYDGIPN